LSPALVVKVKNYQIKSFLINLLPASEAEIYDGIKATLTLIAVINSNLMNTLKTDS